MKKGEPMKIQNMKRSETTEQINLFTWADHNLLIAPELKTMYHVPNEGKRNQTTGGILKAAGMRKGVPDIVLPAARKGFHGLYIEMKFGKNKPTKDQAEFMAALEKQGYKTAVAYGFTQAREIIRGYLAKAPGFDLVNCEDAAKVWDYCEGVEHEMAPCNNCEFYKANKKKGE